MPPKKAARWSIKEGFRATLPKDVARLSPATLTPHQLLSAYGLAPPSSTSPPQLRTCSNRWTLDDSQELQTRIIETITLESDDDSDPIASPSPLKAKKPAAKGKGKGKAKESSTTLCSAEKCANNPNCLNWLGQAKWENAAKALSDFRKAAGVGTSPGNERDVELPVGLKNLGATCYVNSLLQVWYQDETFRAGVYACQPPSNGKVDASPLFQLQILFTFLQTAQQSVYNPVSLVSALKLDTGEQQDAQEFNKLFLNLLDHEFKKQDPLSGGPNVSNLIENQFEGQVIYGIQCSKCRKKSERRTNFFEMEVNLVKDCKLEDRIRESLREEKMTDDNQYHCEACDIKVDATRYTILDCLPPVLHFSLLRFVFSAVDFERSKSNHAISYPLKLNMGQFLPIDDRGKPQEIWYDLKGVLMHKGKSAHHGHYVAQVHDNTKQKWFLFDDECVSPVDDLNAPDRYDEEEVVSTKTAKAKLAAGFTRGKDGDVLPKSKDAYMLIYTRRDDSARRASAPIEPTPPPLASLKVEQLDAKDNEAIKAFEKEDAVVIANFERLRDAKRSVYRAWDLSPDDTDSFLVSKTQLRSWIEAGIIPVKPPAKDVDAVPEELKADLTNGDESSAVPESTAEEVVPTTNGDAEMVPESVVASPTTDSKSTLSNENIVCPHGLLNPTKAEQMKRIGFLGIAALQELGVTVEPALSAPDDLCRTCVWGMVVESDYARSHLLAVKGVKDAVDDDPPGSIVSKAWYSDWIKETPRMHVTNSASDPHPGSTKDWIADVLCEHQKLQPDVKKRRRISSESSALLESLFPDWTPISHRTKVCGICDNQHEESLQSLADLKEMAKKEKAIFKSFDNQTRLSSAQLVISRGTDHFLIPRDFPRQWTKWSRGNVKPSPRPDDIDNSPFLCEHGRVVIDIDRELSTPTLVEAVSEKDWKALQKAYNAGPPIKIFQDDFDSGKYKTLPAICSTCLDLKRKSFSTTDLNVKILNDTEFDADGNRKAQPTVEPASSPEVEIIPASRKRKAPSLAVVAPPTPAGSRSSNRIRNAPQIRAAKAMHIIQMDKEDSVKDLKIKIHERLNIPTIYQRLFLDARELESSETVAELNLCGGDTIGLLEVKVDDGEVDLSLLDDTIDEKQRTKARKTKKAREEGFGGTGLFGFDLAQVEDDVEMIDDAVAAATTNGKVAAEEMEVEVEGEGTNTEPRISSSGSDTLIADADPPDSVPCPTCTFEQNYLNDDCECCGNSMSVG